jgi:hypothetical protein
MSVSEVWVAALVVTAIVNRRAMPVTAPLSSVDALFGPTTNETITRAMVVAAAATEDECRKALSDWHNLHPDVHGEDIVDKVPFGRVNAGEQSAPEERRCQECGGPAGIGFFCERCTKAMWARSKASFQGDEDEALAT